MYSSSAARFDSIVPMPLKIDGNFLEWLTMLWRECNEDELFSEFTEEEEMEIRTEEGKSREGIVGDQ